jgi:precorrin-4/cobalt-precorrin-4 C11-methyltransferase
MKVYFVGAGPGDPELITCKGRRLLGEAEVIIYAGSLVNPEVFLEEAVKAEVYDSASMNLDEVTTFYERERDRAGIIVRLHTGDPSLYGAIQEQIDFLKEKNIPFEVVPGVSSFSAAAASLGQEYTLPGVSQSLIISRISGRTKTPESEDIGALAKYGASMVLFLSIGKIEDVVEKLKEGYSEETPVAVVYRASWKDEKKVLGTLTTIAEKVKESGITRQALVIVGDVLRAQTERGTYEKSKLYDKKFTHGYRKGKD